MFRPKGHLDGSWACWGLPSTSPPPKLGTLPSGLGPLPVDVTSCMSLGPVVIASLSVTRSTVDGVVAGSSLGQHCLDKPSALWWCMPGLNFRTKSNTWSVSATHMRRPFSLFESWRATRAWWSVTTVKKCPSKWMAKWSIALTTARHSNSAV